LGVRRRAGAERCGLGSAKDVAGAMEVDTAGGATFAAGGALIGDTGDAADAASGAEASAGATSVVGASVAAAGGLDAWTSTRGAWRDACTQPISAR
jgi:hypothetical protein